MKPEDLAYDAVAEWKKRALEAEAKLKRVAALPEAWRLQQRITAREAGIARELAAELQGALRD